MSTPTLFSLRLALIFIPAFLSVTTIYTYGQGANFHESDVCDSQTRGEIRLDLDTFKEILEKHKVWLAKKATRPKWERANFCGENLTRFFDFIKNADLSYADLRHANLQGINLTRKNISLKGASLQKANLEGANLYGVDLQGANLAYANLSKAQLDKANLEEAILEFANLYGAEGRDANMKKAFLPEANLEKASLSNVNMEYAILEGANLKSAWLRNAKMGKANLQGTNLENASLNGADLHEADLSFVKFPKARFDKGTQTIWFNFLTGANLKGADITGTDLSGVAFNLKPGGIPLIPSIAEAKNLDKLFYIEPSHSLTEIQNGLKTAGMRKQERILTYVIKHGETELKRTSQGLTALEGNLLYLLFELTSDWGMTPMRPLHLLLKLILICALPYSLVVSLSRVDGMRGNCREGIWAVRPREEERNPKDKSLKAWECIHPSFFFPNLHTPYSTKNWWWLWGIPSRIIATLFAGLYFSVLSAFHIGWRDLNMGSWISRLQPRDFALRATGRVKIISGLQSLISVYLLALWALTYFGRPFE